MTLERVEAAPATALDSWTGVVESVAALAEQIAGTDFVPKGLRDNVPAVTAAILHGRELGLGPMTALAQTHVIDGKPTLSAEAQRALVFAAGHDMEFLESTGLRCTVRGRRAGSDRWTSVTWTIDGARQIGIANKAVWRQYPRAMLAARASAELCRLVFPDVLHGTAATEELDGDAEPVTKPATRPVGRQTRPVAAIPPPVAEPAVEPPPAWEPPPPVSSPVKTEKNLPPDPPKVDWEASGLPPDTDPAPPEPVTPAQLKMLGVLWNRFGVSDDERREYTARMVGRDLGGTTKNLTRVESHGLITRLAAILRPLAATDDVMAEDVTTADARAALEHELSHNSHNQVHNSSITGEAT